MGLIRFELDHTVPDFRQAASCAATPGGGAYGAGPALTAFPVARSCATPRARLVASWRARSLLDRAYCRAGWGLQTRSPARWIGSAERLGAAVCRPTRPPDVSGFLVGPAPQAAAQRAPKPAGVAAGRRAYAAKAAVRLSACRQGGPCSLVLARTRTRVPFLAGAGFSSVAGASRGWARVARRCC